MLLKTRVFDLYIGRYRNLSELAKAMDISVSQIYRVLEGKRNINRKFIIGAIKAFPGYKFDDLFYFVPAEPAVKFATPKPLEETKDQFSEPPIGT
jgi:predicted transcriptional regulator